MFYSSFLQEDTRFSIRTSALLLHCYNYCLKFGISSCFLIFGGFVPSTQQGGHGRKSKGSSEGNRKSSGYEISRTLHFVFVDSVLGSTGIFFSEDRRIFLFSTHRTRNLHSNLRPRLHAVDVIWLCTKPANSGFWIPSPRSYTSTRDSTRPD